MAKSKYIIHVDVKDLADASLVAQSADLHYRPAIDEKRKVILSKRFEVHETRTGTIVVNYKKGAK